MLISSLYILNVHNILLILILTKERCIKYVQNKDTVNYVFEISNVHNERNINLQFVILVRISLNGLSGDCKSKK